MVNAKRIRIIHETKAGNGPVVYVMNRDFRTDDNWALIHAQNLAHARKVPLAILVHIGKNFIEGTSLHHHFFIDGLREVAESAEAHNIPFFITMGDWHSEFKKFIDIHKIGTVVTDFSPLREVRNWWDEIIKEIDVPVIEVDAHNIIPAFLVSDKEEFAAYTLRKKLRGLYPEFSGAIPEISTHRYDWGVGVNECWPRMCEPDGCVLIDWAGLRHLGSHRKHIPGKVHFKPGMKAAHSALHTFIHHRLTGYDKARNDPTKKGQSDLSPYLRYGFISSQRVAYEVTQAHAPDVDTRAFLEELVVRRELSDNFCLYQKHYDTYEGLRPWAKRSFDAHRNDAREYTYTYEEFEHAKTHDELWNAAQLEMIKRGKMHGYMRMYWAKKILEWTNSPEEAIEIGVRLNDTYSLDGRDPNGYVGILWSMGGVHDRAWFDREVFGKIRYMNYNGCKRKFDVDAYIEYAHAL